MSKGIVMEQHQKFIIVMTPEGLFEKAHPVTGAEIGFEVYYEPYAQKQLGKFIRERFFTMRVATLAMIFLLVMLPIYMAINGNETYAYVDIDINPSVEFEINDDLEVSSIMPLNSDATNLLEKIDNLKGEKIADAISVIIQASEENGFANAAKNVLVGVHYVDEEKVLTSPVREAINKYFANKESDWKVLTVAIPEDVRMEAEETKKSMNEVLAKKVVATEVTNAVEEDIVSKEDKEVLKSFFTNKNTNKTLNNNSQKKQTAVEKKPNENNVKDKTHPSELKWRNSERNPGHGRTNKKDHSNNGHQNNKQNNENGNNNHEDHKDNQGNGNNGNNGNYGNNGNNGNQGNNGHNGNNNGNNGHNNKPNHGNGQGNK